MVIEEQTKITEIRSQLDKIYEALETQREGLERNTAELEKARTSGNVEAETRLVEMEKLFKEEIANLEQKIEQSKTELKTAQEKLVQARDVASQMDKAAVDTKTTGMKIS